MECFIIVQSYFGSSNLNDLRDNVTVHIPRSNVVNNDAIMAFAQYRDDVLRSIRGGHHNEQ